MSGRPKRRSADEKRSTKRRSKSSKHDEDDLLNSDDDQTISSSEDDNSDAAVKALVNASIEEHTTSKVHRLHSYLDQLEFVRKSNDPETNIVNRLASQSNGCRCLTDYAIPKFFKLYEDCRIDSCSLMIYEKQNAESSSIMLDFDIYQSTHKSYLVKQLYQALLEGIMAIFAQHMKLPDDPDEFIYVAILQKPNVKFIKTDKTQINADGIESAVKDPHAGAYKDGFHILFPSIMISRVFKRYLIDVLCKSKLVENVMKLIPVHESSNISDFLDKNSAHVPCYFYGSFTKPGHKPYVLKHLGIFRKNLYNNAFELTLGSGFTDIPIGTQDGKSIDLLTYLELHRKSALISKTLKRNINYAYELSMNWSRFKSRDEDFAIIDKKHYEPLYPDLVQTFSANQTASKSSSDTTPDQEEDEYKELSQMFGPAILTAHFPTAKLIKALIDILNPERAREYKSWFEVLCVLANESELDLYKPLAIYFSKKAIDKWNEITFEKVWTRAKKNSAKKLTLGSLHYWAKEDNPELYQAINSKTIYGLIHNRVYDPITEGKLGHYDIATILYALLKHKYVTYVEPDQKNPAAIWYEFITPEMQYRDGELYKWRITKSAPMSLKKYISESLTDVFRRTLEQIKEKFDAATDNNSKYLNKIYGNFRATCNGLWTNAFKLGILKEAEVVFNNPKFHYDMDKDPNLLGVGNGVLVLHKDGRKPELIQGYHGYRISRFTPVPYIPFNPRDENIKKVLRVMRNLHPDNEHDAYEFMMYYDASCLDGHKKESMIGLIVGKGSNGKSMRTEMLKGVLANYAVKMPLAFLTDIRGNHDSATPALMALKNARLAYYSESNRNEVLNSARVKEVTGMETISGRELYGTMENFKPSCHHMVGTNHDFAIHDNTHGMWRRLKYMKLKITFKLPHEPYDPNNPYERKADTDISEKWSEDSNMLAAYLSILTYYYSKLHAKYKGKVQNVPHPTVRVDTKTFQTRQDIVSRFIRECLVVAQDKEILLETSKLNDEFNKWYTSIMSGGSESNAKHGSSNNFIDVLENSKLATHITRNNRGVSYLKGFRVIKRTEDPGEGEVMFSQTEDEVKYECTMGDLNNKPFEQLYDEICRDYDEHVKTKSDEDSDVDGAPMGTFGAHQTSNYRPKTLMYDSDYLDSDDERSEQRDKKFIKEIVLTSHCADIVKSTSSSSSSSRREIKQKPKVDESEDSDSEHKSKSKAKPAKNSKSVKSSKCHTPKSKK